MLKQKNSTHALTLVYFFNRSFMSHNEQRLLDKELREIKGTTTNVHCMRLNPKSLLSAHLFVTK